MQTGEFDFYYDDMNNAGIKGGHNDNFKSAIMLAIEYDLIKQGGAWFYIDKGTEDEKKFQGLDKLIDYIRKNPDIIDRYKEDILEIESKVKE